MASADITRPPPVAIAAPALRVTFAWTLTGSVIYAACQWGMISVLAKLGKPAIVGQFALGLAITAPVFMFTNLQLRAVQATDARSEYDFADCFTLRCLATFIGLCVVTGIVLVSRYDWPTALVILLVAASKAVESLSDVIAGLLQKYERLDRVAIGFTIRGIVSVTAFGLVFWKTHNLIAAAATLLLAWTAVVLAYDFQMARRVMLHQDRFFRANWPILRRLVTLSLPLGIVMTLISLNVNIPRYIIEHRFGASELGIFASLAYMVVAINLIVNALGQSASARLARHFAAGEITAFNRILKHLIAIGAAILVVGLPVTALVGRPIVTLLYTAQYARQLPVLLVIVATAGVNAIGSFLGYGMTAARSFRAQVPVIAAVTVSTFIAALILVPRMGVLGAAAALLISSSIQVVGSLWVLTSAITSARN